MNTFHNFHHFVKSYDKNLGQKTSYFFTEIYKVNIITAYSNLIVEIIDTKFRLVELAVGSILFPDGHPSSKNRDPFEKPDQFEKP